MQKYEITELDSGERVITERVPSVRSVSLGYWIGAGSRDEKVDRAGVSHFLEHLLFKGSSSYSAQEIAETFDGLGGELNAATSREHTVLYSRVTDAHLETAVDVMTDMVFAPTFAELDSEREVVLEEIAMYEDTPQELVHDLFSEAVFGNQPLGRPVIGTRDVIASVSRRALAAYHRSMYVGGNVVVAAAGNLQHNEVVRLLERAQRRPQDTPPKGVRVRRPMVTPPPPSLRFQQKDTEQYHVCIGAPGISRSDRRRFAASLLDSILGGSASSRLFQEIREKRGMAYAVYSFTSQYTDTGLVGFYVGTREENVAECLEIAIAGDRRHLGRAAPAERAPAREGEPEGPRRALDGVDLEPHEPARQVADHGHRAALARPADRGDRRGRAGRDLGARIGAASARTPLGLRHRPGRAHVTGRGQGDQSGPCPRRSSCVKICLYGRGGKVGRVLAPALEAAGHELAELEAADAAVDFTAPDTVVDNVLRALDAGVPCVVGTSGADLVPVDTRARERGLPVFFAPNFAIGAVLMMRLAAEAAAYLPRAEIVELHNEAKKDAPSGTARATADSSSAMCLSTSVRLPGLVAHQEVLLGGDGQLLTIRHDAFTREAYVPGVLLALERLRGLAARLDRRARRPALDV